MGLDLTVGSRSRQASSWSVTGPERAEEPTMSQFSTVNWMNTYNRLSYLRKIKKYLEFESERKRRKFYKRKKWKEVGKKRT